MRSSSIFLALGLVLLVASCKQGPEGPCTPITCGDANAGCGVIDDHCGGNLFCGHCDAPSTCNPTTNTCECAATPNACDGKCGKLLDDCGQEMTCGGCADGQNCGGGGPNVCGDATCTPAVCGDTGATCGTIADGCGELVTCGTCTAPQTCGGDGQVNVCACKAVTCAELGKDCDAISDACGAMINCGTCSGDKTCGGGGVANVCGSPSAAGTAVLSWTAPTMNTDGSALPASQIGGYHVYYGVASKAYGPPLDVGNVAGHTLAGLSSGATYFFAVSVYDKNGNESDLSAEAMKTFP